MSGFGGPGPASGPPKPIAFGTAARSSGPDSGPSPSPRAGSPFSFAAQQAPVLSFGQVPQATGPAAGASPATYFPSQTAPVLNFSQASSQGTLSQGIHFGANSSGSQIPWAGSGAVSFQFGSPQPGHGNPQAPIGGQPAASSAFGVSQGSLQYRPSLGRGSSTNFASAEPSGLSVSPPTVFGSGANRSPSGQATPTQGVAVAPGRALGMPPRSKSPPRSRSPARDGSPANVVSPVFDSNLLRANSMEAFRASQGGSTSTQSPDSEELAMREQRARRFQMTLPPPASTPPRDREEQRPKEALPITTPAEAVRPGQMDLEQATAMQGTCPDMCAEEERTRRAQDGALHKYERVNGNIHMTSKDLAVKKFTRNVDRRPEIVRPLPVLLRTMGYLLDLLNQGYNSDLNDLHKFLWDRMRSIRQDLQLQHIFDENSIRLHEQMIRFHILAMHELCEEVEEVDPEAFKPHLNIEQLEKCFISLFQMYKDQAKKGVYSPQETEFLAYSVLLALDNHGKFRPEPSQVPDRLGSIRPELLNTPEVKFAVDIAKAYKHMDFLKFFKLVKQATYLQACLLHGYFPKMRAFAIRIVRQSGKGNIPLVTLQKWLAMDAEEARDLLDYHGQLTGRDNAADSHPQFLLSQQGQFPGFRPPPFQECPEGEEGTEQKLRLSQVIVIKRAGKVMEDVLNPGRPGLGGLGLEGTREREVSPEPGTALGSDLEGESDMLEEGKVVPTFAPPASPAASPPQPDPRPFGPSSPIFTAPPTAGATLTSTNNPLLGRPISRLDAAGSAVQGASVLCGSPATVTAVPSPSLPMVDVVAVEKARAEELARKARQEEEAARAIAQAQQAALEQARRQKQEQERLEDARKAAEAEQKHREEVERQRAEERRKQEEERRRVEAERQRKMAERRQWKRETAVKTLRLWQWRARAAEKGRTRRALRALGEVVGSGLDIDPSKELQEAYKEKLQALEALLQAPPSDRPSRLHATWAPFGATLIQAVAKGLQQSNTAPYCTFKLALHSSLVDGRERIDQHLLGLWLQKKLRGVYQGGDTASPDQPTWHTVAGPANPRHMWVKVQEVRKGQEDVSGASGLLYVLVPGGGQAEERRQVAKLVDSVPSEANLPLLVLTTDSTDWGAREADAQSNVLNFLHLRSPCSQGRVGAARVIFLSEGDSQAAPGWYSSPRLLGGLEWLAEQSPRQPALLPVTPGKLVNLLLAPHVHFLQEELAVGRLTPKHCVNVFNTALDKAQDLLELARAASPKGWPPQEVSRGDELLPPAGWGGVVNQVLRRLSTLRLPSFDDDSDNLPIVPMEGFSDLAVRLQAYLRGVLGGTSEIAVRTYAARMLSRGATVIFEEGGQGFAPAWGVSFQEIFLLRLSALDDIPPLLVYLEAQALTELQSSLLPLPLATYQSTALCYSPPSNPLIATSEGGKQSSSSVTPGGKQRSNPGNPSPAKPRNLETVFNPISPTPEVQASSNRELQRSDQGGARQAKVVAEVGGKRKAAEANVFALDSALLGPTWLKEAMPELEEKRRKLDELIKHTEQENERLAQAASRSGRMLKELTTGRLFVAQAPSAPPSRADKGLHLEDPLECVPSKWSVSLSPQSRKRMREEHLSDIEDKHDWQTSQSNQQSDSTFALAASRDKFQSAAQAFYSVASRLGRTEIMTPERKLAGWSSDGNRSAPLSA